MTITAMTKLSGTVAGISYRNDENGYTVMRFEPAQADMFRGSSVTVVGLLNPEPFEDEELILVGAWAHHPKYGEQFKLDRVEGRKSPQSRAGLIAYLSSGKFPGVGFVTAERIIDFCGGPDQVADVFENTPEELANVSGITKTKAQELATVWETERDARDTMTYLCGLGLTVNAATKIWNTYKDAAIATVQENPYVLAWDIDGIGFKRADEIARAALSMPPDAPYRIEAGVLHALKEARGNGHVYLPSGVLANDAGQLLGVNDLSLVYDAIATMADRDPEHGAAVVQDGGNVYLPAYHRAEVMVAGKLAELLTSPVSALDKRFKDRNRAELLRNAASRLPFTLTDQQYKAVQVALGSKVSVITGGPGTGKSTILRMVVDVLDAVGAAFELAAPTGRAAKRMAETTGFEARTLHRLLEWKPERGGGGRFQRNQYDPLEADFIIIDEFSMVDLRLCNSLLKAVESKTHLLLVGDVDQLPSVGAGDVLRDLINSDVIPVTRLDTIFRQGDKSKIITNAHAINNGEMPDTDNDSDDFFFFSADTPDAIGDWIVDIVTNRLPSKFGYDPVRDVQILSPMYKTGAGVNALNSRLQAVLNPPAPGKLERKQGFRLFRVGDKVMQLKNNYDKGAYNGDVGYITAMHPDGLTVGDTSYSPCMTVDMDGEDVVYKFEELDQLTLAYAATVHKSQGSEYPVVVMPVTTSHYVMLQKGLLYTAVTRGKKIVVLVGQRQAVGIAVRTNPAEKRNSGLIARLKFAKEVMG